MAITQVGTAVLPTGNPTTGFTVGIGSGVVTDDVLVISITNRDGTGDPSVTDNDTGGNAWAKLGGGATGLSVWWKRATSATASKTVTVGSCVGSSSGVLAAFRGVTKAATPYENVTTESNASANETHAAISPTRDGCWVFLCVANRTNDIAIDTQAATSPAVLTELGEKLSTGGSDCANSMAAAEQATAGSTGSITWAQTDAASVSCVFDLLPAVSMVAAQGSFTETGNAAGLTVQRKIVAAQGAFVETGNAAGLFRGYPMAAAVGSFALVGNDATLTYTPSSGYTLTADAGAFAETGNDAGLTAQRKLTANAGAFAETGNSAGLTAQRKATVDAGVFVETGNSAGLFIGRKVVADTGTFSETGNDAGLTAQRKVTANAGTFALTGNDATLTYTPTGAYSMVASTGSFALSGQGAGLIAARKLAIDAGAFALTGNDATLTYTPSGAYSMVAAPGSFSIIGAEAGLWADHRLTSDAGTFAETGNDAGLTAQRKLTVDVGAFVETGNSAGLIAARRLAVAVGVFTLTGNDNADPGASYYSIAANSGAFVLTGYDTLSGEVAAPPVQDIKHSFIGAFGQYQIVWRHGRRVVERLERRYPRR